MGRGKAPAITRAAAALRLLGRNDRPMSLTAIAQSLDIGPSACLYVLRALVDEELVAFDPQLKRYSLEAGVLTLARQWLRQNPFPDLVQPVLDAMARRFGITMLGVQIVDLDHVIVLAVSAAAGRFALSTAVGSRFPALISATGRCIAAFGDHSRAEVVRRFEALRWDHPPPLDTWLGEIETTRARGFGVDEGNYMAGATVVAAPVRRRQGNPSHALVAIGISEAIRPIFEPLTAAMLAEARMLSV